MERILLESILPNANLRYESVEWRKVFLWTLPVDDLLKANMDNIKRVFGMIKKGPYNYLRFDDVQNYIQNTDLPVSLDDITLAFSFSKMQFVDELELIDNYKQITFVEFLEFLGRLAFLIWYDNQDEPLEVKLWRLMATLFGDFGEKVKGVELEDDVDSESDYEDEIACSLLMQQHPEELYAGFGILRTG